MNEFIFNLPSNELMNYILATIVQAGLKIDIGRFRKLYLLALCYLNDARIDIRIVEMYSKTPQ